MNQNVPPQMPHPGWCSLAKFFDTQEALFDHILLLLGYEFSSNSYVITGDYLVVVDPGNDYTAFMELWDSGRRPEEVKKVVFTHGHPDHAMGFVELLRGYSPGQAGDLELLMHEAGPRQFKELAAQAGCRLTLVRGGETVDLGGAQWEVVHTPGHTIDGICLFHSPSKTAFTGDTVLPHAMAGADRYAGGSLELYLVGLRELLRRDIANVLPGHGLPVASAGKRIIEETYEGLMMKILGAEEEKRIPWMAGAAALARGGLFEEAIYCCNKAEACSPGDLSPRQLKALCLSDLGRFPEALALFETLSSGPTLSASDVFPLVGKGYALMGMGKYAESIALFDQALGLNPRATDALVYKGMALYLSGQPEQAMEIEPFREEFLARFKDEIARRKGPAS